MPRDAGMSASSVITAATTPVPAGALEHVEACDLCGGRELRVRAHYRDNILGGEQRWRLARCANCGLHMLTPRPTRSAIGAHYPDATAYVPYQQTGIHEPSWWQRRAGSREAGAHGFLTRAILRIRDDYAWFQIPRWQGEGRILDVGCASGKFLDIMRGLGWTTFGVEMNPAAAQRARDAGHEVVVGAADAAHFPAGTFDVVYLWHVLEHMHSPKQALAMCRQMLRPGGTLILATPNYGSLQARLWRGLWDGIEAPRHLHQFDRTTMRAYLEGAGFRSVKVRTRTGAIVPARGLRFAANRVLKTRWQRDPAWLVGAFEAPLLLSNLVGFLGMGSELRASCVA